MVAEEVTWTLRCEGRQGSESKESEVRGFHSQAVTKGESPGRVRGCGQRQPWAC